MKTPIVTTRLDSRLQELLDETCRESGRTRSDIVREAVKRRLSIVRFDRVQRRVLPFADAAAKRKHRSTR